ncbi:serine hydrolase domain-containing protein [Enterococcus sp. LJL120]
MRKKWWILSSALLIIGLIGLVSWRLLEATPSVSGQTATETTTETTTASEVILDEPIQANNLDGSAATKEKINQILSEDRFAGVALIVQNGQLFSNQGYGYADAANAQTNEAATAFPVASIQKTLTGILIAQLVTAGELSYDQSLADFYPQVENSSAITVRMLLNQTSGIQMDEIAPAEVLTTQAEQLDYVLESLNSTNDFDFYYTNANYTLLAGIISQISGVDYETYLTEKIIQPLNLQGTYFWDTLPENVAVPNPYYYDLETNTEYLDYGPELVRDRPLFSSLLGAGNLLMTAEDLLKVQEALREQTLISSQAFFELLETDSGYSAGYWQGEQLESAGVLGAYTSIIYTDWQFQNIVILLENQVGLSDVATLAEDIYSLTAI